MGDKLGRIHMQKQDIDKLQTRKVRALKKSKAPTNNDAGSKKKKRRKTDKAEDGRRMEIHVGLALFNFSRRVVELERQCNSRRVVNYSILYCSLCLRPRSCGPAVSVSSRRGHEHDVLLWKRESFRVSNVIIITITTATYAPSRANVWYVDYVRVEFHQSWLVAKSFCDHLVATAPGGTSHIYASRIFSAEASKEKQMKSLRNINPTFSKLCSGLIDT